MGGGGNLPGCTCFQRPLHSYICQLFCMPGPLHATCALFHSMPTERNSLLFLSLYYTHSHAKWGIMVTFHQQIRVYLVMPHTVTFVFLMLHLELDTVLDMAVIIL